MKHADVLRAKNWRANMSPFAFRQEKNLGLFCVFRRQRRSAVGGVMLWIRYLLVSFSSRRVLSHQEASTGLLNSSRKPETGPTKESEGWTASRLRASPPLPPPVRHPTFTPTHGLNSPFHNFAEFGVEQLCACACHRCCSGWETVPVLLVKKKKGTKTRKHDSTGHPLTLEIISLFWPHHYFYSSSTNQHFKISLDLLSSGYVIRIWSINVLPAEDVWKSS